MKRKEMTKIDVLDNDEMMIKLDINDNILVPNISVNLYLNQEGQIIMYYLNKDNKCINNVECDSINEMYELIKTAIYLGNRKVLNVSRYDTYYFIRLSAPI